MRKVYTYDWVLRVGNLARFEAWVARQGVRGGQNEAVLGPGASPPQRAGTGSLDAGSGMPQPYTISGLRNA
jgi:hypothetical protein